MNEDASNVELGAGVDGNPVLADQPEDTDVTARELLGRLVGQLERGTMECYTQTERLESLALESYALMASDWDTPWHGTVWVQATTMRVARRELTLGEGPALMLDGKLGGTCASIEELTQTIGSAGASPGALVAAAESDSIIA